ncbi:monocarboxylate transporter 3-like [Haliotis asinina]|uniref:monocarboxylate transporter 3-like n=1 Tax=Haliotis asinina TaxID=109174 RepID=UPI0035327519
MEHTKRDHDRYWKTVAFISCFMSIMIFNSFTETYGVLYIYMREPLQTTEYKLSWIGSLMSGFFGITSLLTSVLVERVGSRYTHLLGGLVLASSVMVSSLTSSIYVLYLTLGVLPGVGSSLVFISSTVHLNRLFSRWRPLAAGGATIGGAVAGLVWPQLISSLADAFHWWGALLIHGALVLHMLPCALNIKHKRNMTTIQYHIAVPVTWDSKVQKEALWKRFRGQVTTKAPGYNSFCLSYFFLGLGIMSFPTFIPDYVMTSLPGHTSSEVALIVSISGAGNILGRCLFSVVAMLHPNFPLHISITATIACGLINVIVVLCQNMNDFYITGGFYGLAFGGFSVAWCPMLVRLFGLENLPKFLGGQLLMQGIGSLCGPPLLSYLADVSGQNEIIFYTTGASFISSFLVVLPFLLGRQCGPGHRDDCPVAGVTNQAVELESIDSPV